MGHEANKINRIDESTGLSVIENEGKQLGCCLFIVVVESKFVGLGKSD